MVCFSCLLACNRHDEESDWFRLMKGTVNDSPVSVYLYKSGHRYDGFYDFDSLQAPVDFSGSDTIEKGKIVLTTNGEEQADTFILSFDNHSASGTWQPGGQRALQKIALTQVVLPVSFTYVKTDTSVLLNNKVKESPGAYYDAAAVWPTGKTAVDEFVKTNIRTLFPDTSRQTDIRPMLRELGKSFVADYLDMYSDVLPADIIGFPASYNSDLRYHVGIVFANPHLFTLSLFTSSYTGGAHGNYSTQYRSLDMDNQRVLTLPHILTAAGIRQLRPMLEASFRKQFGLKPSEPLGNAGLFEERILPNENLLITGKGLGFAYSPYEIGPFAMGEIDIVVPYSDLAAYLQPGFKKLL